MSWNDEEVGAKCGIVKIEIMERFQLLAIEKVIHIVTM